MERLREWQETYCTLYTPERLRPSTERKAAARRTVDYWTRPQRRFRVVHQCGCEERYTLPEDGAGRREVERLREMVC